MTIWAMTPPERPWFDALAEDYEESTEFTIEACRHVADDPDSLPPDLLQAIRQHYRDSDAFTTRIDDAIADGIVTW